MSNDTRGIRRGEEPVDSKFAKYSFERNSKLQFTIPLNDDPHAMAYSETDVEFLNRVENEHYLGKSCGWDW